MNTGHKQYQPAENSALARLLPMSASLRFRRPPSAQLRLDGFGVNGAYI